MPNCDVSLSQFFLVVVILGPVSGTVDWTWQGEKGPEFWSETYPDCGGKIQSPIDIPHDSIPACLTSIRYTNLKKQHPEMMLLNGMRGAELHFEQDSQITATKGPLSLNETFYLYSIFFHVGSNNSVGSGHKLRGKQFPLEMELVFSNSPHPDATSLYETGCDLFIISFFGQLSDNDNYHLDPLVQGLYDITEPGSSTLISFNVESLLPKESWDRVYYTYLGSLTIPPCRENVNVAVYGIPMKISADQLSAFRQLKDEFNYHIVDNFRPVQPHNNRRVWKSYKASPYKDKYHY